MMRRRATPPVLAIDFAPRPDRRRSLLWLTMVACTTLAIWAAQFDAAGDPEAVSQAVARHAPPPPAEQIVSLTPAVEAPAANPPDAATDTPLPPPPQLLGIMVEDGRRRVLLGRGDESFVLSSGDLLPPDWRVEGIAANTVTLRHLPSGRRLQLDYEPFE
jgi:hypothetical protein